MTEALDTVACKELLRAYIEEDLLFGEDPIADDTPLVAEGILDSVSIIALFAFLEDRVGLRIPEDEVSPEHLEDLGSLSEWVSRLSGER